MTEVLVAVGAFVFFISVYGAVMVGGHLLEELELVETAPAPTPAPFRDLVNVGLTTGSSHADRQPVSTPQPIKHQDI